MAILDPILLDKLSRKTGKNKQYLREQISKRSTRKGITAEAELISWCRGLGIGAGRFFAKQPPHVQEQAAQRDAKEAYRHGGAILASHTKPNRMQLSHRAVLNGAIDYLLRDSPLRGRCKRLLTASRNFDTAFREATTIFEDRLKQKTGLDDLELGDLLPKALNPDTTKAILVVGRKKTEQEGFYLLCRGLTLFFRNTAHHRLSDSFSREDALKFCGFMDALLSVVERASVHKERIIS